MSTLPYPPPQQHQRQPEPGYPQQDPGRDAPYNPPPAIGVPVTSGAQHYNHSAYNNQNYGPTGMVVVQPAAGPIISPEHYWRASMCGDAECDVICGACCTPCVVHGSNAKVRNASRRHAVCRRFSRVLRRPTADLSRLSSARYAVVRSFVRSFAHRSNSALLFIRSPNPSPKQMLHTGQTADACNFKQKECLIHGALFTTQITLTIIMWSLANPWAAGTLQPFWNLPAYYACLQRTETRERFGIQARSIHWFPYDPDRVVNADP
jgi:hypothetical protein